jgi:spore germination cell wall hydrolase CwlJ-like protein
MKKTRILLLAVGLSVVSLSSVLAAETVQKAQVALLDKPSTLASYVDQTDLVATVLVLEAASERQVGMQAVYEVINTRAIAAGKTRFQVVSAETKGKHQFSCLNGRSFAESIAKAKTDPRFKPAWKTAYDIASKEPATSLTKGATHYENSKAFGEPKWASGMSKVVTIGRHSFYRQG